jgi:hypothetical protein
LDQALTAVLGPVDRQTSAAITGICDDAIAGVPGSALAETLRADPRLLHLVASWVMDLARGLQFQSRNAPCEPATTELLTRLACYPLPEDQVRRYAETIDLAAVLTLGRVTEHVLGPGAGARDPAANEAVAPRQPR